GYVGEAWYLRSPAACSRGGFHLTSSMVTSIFPVASHRATLERPGIFVARLLAAGEVFTQRPAWLHRYSRLQATGLRWRGLVSS
ncbi:hypothetical protein, partial [Legionella jamestowniensis]|uniref:hypothetical protein n=1 Tax=Legionella jamestowniensis TaxID=455 RepID=UPI001EE77BD8